MWVSVASFFGRPTGLLGENPPTALGSRSRKDKNTTIFHRVWCSVVLRSFALRLRLRLSSCVCVAPCREVLRCGALRCVRCVVVSCVFLSCSVCCVVCGVACGVWCLVCGARCVVCCVCRAVSSLGSVGRHRAHRSDLSPGVPGLEERTLEKVGGGRGGEG